MSVLFTFLLVIAIILAFILLLGLFMRKEHFVKRDIIINAPNQIAFDFLRFLENQEKFNKYAMKEAERKKEFKGTDGTVGFIFSWSGKKDAGVGEKEIMSLEEGKKIVTEIRFIKPMKISASVIFETESLSDQQTKVSFTNSGILKYPFNIRIPMFEKNFGKDMNESLVMLKNILEK
ncbi:MAG: SRPBCC family protein [Bacteroidota bacterium]